jgi:transglutaminase-like putative cysteine protease
MNEKRYSHWDWPVALLLVAAVFTVAVRLGSTNWTPDLGYVAIFSVLGSCLGLALGISQFQWRGLSWLIIGYTLVVLPAQLSGIITSEKTALGQLASFGGRLVVSFAFLFGGKAIEDHLFFVTLMSTLFWAIGIYTGYRVMRRRAILPVLFPSIVPILIIQYYDGYNPDRIWELAIYFFIALLLIGRINFLRNHEQWEQHQVLAGSEPEFDLNKNMVIAAAIIIMAAWSLPTPAVVLPEAARIWRNISQPFDNTRQRINDALAALHGGSSANTVSELYGNTMGLGRSTGTGKAELFSVRATQNNLPRLYWRVRVYDTYQNGNWLTLNGQNTPFNPEQDSLVRKELLPSPVGEFTFRWQTSQSALLATPSLPVWASRTGWMQIATSKNNEKDLLNWSASPNLQAGDQYQVRALLLSPTRKDLRNAGSIYPAWVTERYLQVPENVSAEISRLATQITSGQETAFGKAEAVTGYLRKNMIYSETIPAPPPGMDPISWFLFGWKNGFCNYYASSEVLLLRSIGIPARMVVGYAQGKSDGYGKYSVRGQDAHAWPEVYFPNIGWVEFEPTVNQFEIVRPSGDAPAPVENDAERITDSELETNPRAGHEAGDPNAGTATPKTTFFGLTQEQWLWVIISVVTVSATGFSVWQLERRKPFIWRVPRAVKAVYIRYNIKSPVWIERWVRWSEVTAVERAFHTINQCLEWLNKPQADNATPAERAEMLKMSVPNVAEDINLLTSALEQTLYSPHPADAANAIHASWRIKITTLRKVMLRPFYGEVNNER